MEPLSPARGPSTAPSASASYLLLTTSPTLAAHTDPPVPCASHQRTRSHSAQPQPQHPRFLPLLLVFALIDLMLVCAYGLPVALREKGVWVGEAVGLLRVAVMSWVALSRGAQRKKGAVLSIVVLSFLLLIYKINETFQRHAFHSILPSLHDLAPPLLPPNALAWYLISFALSLVHLTSYSIIVGVQANGARRLSLTARGRRESILRSHEQRWSGREESVRIDGTPRFGPTVEEGEVPSLSEEEAEFDEDDELLSEEEEEEEDESSSDEEDIIDMPKSGAASIRHRASRASLWREGDEEQRSGTSGGGMQRSASRRSGLSMSRGHGADGSTTYGSFGGI